MTDYGGHVDNIAVLDYGYVRLVESWGSDERIVEAARMSTAKGFQGWGHECDTCNGNAVVANPRDLSPVTCPACKGAGEIKGDEKLLRYLYEHAHHTPFEMAGMIVEVQAPILVFREWHRHRTQCLTGDSIITLVSPRGSTFKRTIREIFDLKYGGVVDSAPTRHKNGLSKAGTPVTREARRKNAWRTRILPNCQERILRVLDESTGVFHTAPMKDVWESGIKRVYRVQASGYSLTTSIEHPFLTRRGWMKAGELRVGDHIARMGKVATDGPPLPPSLRRGIGVWTSMMRNRLIGDTAVCYRCGLTFEKDEIELDHVVPVIDDLKLALDENNLKPICVRCHLEKSANEQPDRREQTRRGVRWERVERLPEYVGEQQTYDLEVDGEHHNYCANDLVVHNSYNEMSARYIQMPNLHYVPSVERIMRGGQGKSNKQGSDTLAIDEHTARLIQIDIRRIQDEGYKQYESLLSMGLAKELARINTPVSRYSRMRASANLRNWLAFLTLRMDEHAQWEIRQYANVVGSLIAATFPRTWDLFEEGRAA